MPSPTPVAAPVRANVHVHLHVGDLAKSRDFYERFLGVAPVKLAADYAKFLPLFAPLNLALSQREDGSAHAGLAGLAGLASIAGHLGLQLESAAAVRAELARVRAAGLAVREEMDVDCCYANQDKFWVTDPDGVEWEIYVLKRDLEPRTATLPTVDCCQ